MDTTSETLGERLQRLREARRLERSELAERARVSYNHIWQIENNRRPKVGADVAARIASELGVSVEYLQTGRDKDGEPIPPDVEPLIERMARLQPDQRQQVVRLVDGILSLAGQPAMRIVGEPPEPKLTPLQQPERNFEELGEMGRLERVLVQELSRLSPEDGEEMIRLALDLAIGKRKGANSGAPTRSGVNHGEG